MGQDPSVGQMFKDLGLEEEEAIALFGVLCADDGEADYKEFLVGALKMRKNCLVSDVVQVMCMQGEMREMTSEVLQAVAGVHESVKNVHTSVRGFTPTGSSL